MTTKKVTNQVKQPVRRSAGRPLKARPSAQLNKRPIRTTIQQRRPVSKTVRQPRSLAQPQVLVVTNQPLVSEEEFSAWQSVRQETTVERPEETISDNRSAELSQSKWVADDNYLSDETGDKHLNRLYRRLALFFVGLIAVVVMVMFYYSLIRVKIILYLANNQEAQSKMIVLTDTIPVATGMAPAKFLQAATEYQQTFPATGQIQSTGVGRLTGQVTLINKTGKDQPLVATTRLLTAEGILYRLRNFVTVPAGGRVSAEAYADQLKPENAISAQTKFTIPGLWAGLQDKIYAVADQPINYQSDSKTIVLATDLEQAISQAKQVAADQVKNKLAQEVGTDMAIYWLDDSSWVISSNAQADEQKSEFTVTVKASAGAAVVSLETINELVLNNDDSGFKLDEQSLDYQLAVWQPEQHQAQLEVSYSASLAADQADQLVDKQALVGLNRQQLENYLSTQPNIISYKVTWQPGFLSKVPGTDKIQLSLGE
jgi:hypothetical protein